MKQTTLVIMAAGMGSRYGGIKQIEPVGPSGEIILDYSIYDAVEAGFDKVVFIIRRDIEEAFREAIGDRIEKRVKVEYVFQNMEDLPGGYSVPAGRTKPWGTGQAILACKDVVNEPFAVINADDYYGKEGLKKVHEYLCNPAKSDKKFNFCMAGFEVGNTLSDNGTVTRGICQVKDGILTKIVETKEIGRGDNCATTPDGNVPLNQPVSMNMWGLPVSFLNELEKGFPEFLDSLKPGDIKAEYLLPKIIDKLVHEGKAKVRVLDTPDKWFGVTYKEDKQAVVDAIKGLIDAGVYKEKLFD